MRLKTPAIATSDEGPFIAGQEPGLQPGLGKPVKDLDMTRTGQPFLSVTGLNII